MTNKEFVHINILELLGLARAPLAIQSALLNEAVGIIMGRVFLEIERALPDDTTRAALHDLVRRQEKKKEREAFLKQFAPDLDKRIVEAAIAFKKEIYTEKMKKQS